MRDEFDAPLLPADVEASDLAPEARMQLKTLDKDNADVVARHLAMVERLIDDDPALAHQHALAASRRAGRIGVVRETLAITAYQLEDFGLALRELRTFRRITGSDEQLPLMVDCERGLGRPEKALELSRSVDAATLPTPVRVELAIARSGARLDLGQTQAALDELRIPELQRDVAYLYSPALFAAFATVLEELGRDEEAAEWIALADRAIDALQAAADPGEAETVRVTEEWVDVPYEGLEDEGLEDEQTADEQAEDDRVQEQQEQSVEDADEQDSMAGVVDGTHAESAAAPIDAADALVDTSAAAIEAEVEALLADVQDTTVADDAASSHEEDEADVALFAIEPEDAGESATELAESDAAQAEEPAPDAPAHEADASDDDAAGEGPRA
ncbi:hypothetical protein [Agrococcus sp. SGAir0287]|uniref:hypothetical protein n=1 Tax=Agrococcus sp. SGAir0287 TaxID=2070347 RepID=UPI0010CD686D|nr:hypothetical protein [Agrococcus sp. SGAir0287]QCR19585.1 hypothetical protein C1N71_09245 [Agrococcus sp. SGAir0287]